MLYPSRVSDFLQKARGIFFCRLSLHHLHNSGSTAFWHFAHLCGDMSPASAVSTVNHQSLPRIWCPAWCCFLQEEGEQRKSKTGHLQICQGSSSSPPLCPWGENAPEEAVSLSFYPPYSALALLCSLWDICSYLILLFSLVTLINWRPDSRPSMLNLHFAKAFFFTQFTKIENCMIYYVFKETGWEIKHQTSNQTVFLTFVICFFIHVILLIFPCT